MGDSTVPTQEAEYIVFVRDNETGASAYSTVAIKAPIVGEQHLLRMPGEDYKVNLRYSAAVPVSPTRK